MIQNFQISVVSFITIIMKYYKRRNKMEKIVYYLYNETAGYISENTGKPSVTQHNNKIFFSNQHR